MRSAIRAQREQLLPLATAERMTVAADEQQRAQRLKGAIARSSGPASPAATAGDAVVPVASACEHGRARECRSPIAASTFGVAEQRAPVRVELGSHAVREPHRRDRSTAVACMSCSTVSSASSRGSGKRSTSCHSSTEAPSTSPISRTSSGTRSSLGSTTANSSTATCSLRSSTSMPTMSAPSAPMRDATQPERARTVGKPDPHDQTARRRARPIRRRVGMAQRRTPLRPS